MFVGSYSILFIDLVLGRSKSYCVFVVRRREEELRGGFIFCFFVSFIVGYLLGGNWVKR